jgi:hypothetical protein
MAYPMAERRFEQGIYHKEQFRAALQKNSHEIALFSLENFADFLLDEVTNEAPFLGFIVIPGCVKLYEDIAGNYGSSNELGMRMGQ